LAELILYVHCDFSFHLFSTDVPDFIELRSLMRGAGRFQ
jgi:hypothetical protein